MNMNFYFLFFCCEFNLKKFTFKNIYVNSKFCCRGIVDIDLVGYIWYEFFGDIFVNMVWIIVIFRLNFDNFGGFIMKVKVYISVI